MSRGGNNQDDFYHIRIGRKNEPISKEYGSRYESIKRLDHAKADRAEHDNMMRHNYCERSYKITVFWIICIAVFVFTQTVSTPLSYHMFGVNIIEITELSNAKFIAITVTSSGLVFGFWLIVGKGLFNKSGNES